MTTTVWLRRTHDGFRFASEMDRIEISGKIGVGKLVKAQITQPRSNRQNRWARALVRAVWEQQSHYPTADALWIAIQVRLGYVDQIIMRDGEVIITPKSPAFDKMSQAEFNGLVDNIWKIIGEEIIPGLSEHGQRELQKRLDELMRGSR